MDNVTFTHNGPYGSMSIPLQRVTSLYRRAQANARAASNWPQCSMFVFFTTGHSHVCVLLFTGLIIGLVFSDHVVVNL